MSKNINTNTNKNNINIKILLDKVRKTKRKIKKVEGAGGAGIPAPVQQQVVVQPPPPPPPQPQFYRVAMPNYGNRPYLQDQEQTPQELQSNFDSFDAERQALVQSYLEQAQNIAGVPEDTSASVLPAEQEVPAEFQTESQLPAEQQALPSPPQAPMAELQTESQLPAEQQALPSPPQATVAKEEQPQAPQTAPQVQEIQNLMEQMTTSTQQPDYLMRILTQSINQLLSSPSREVIQSLQNIGFESRNIESRGQNRIQIKNPRTGNYVFADRPLGRELIQERRQDILTGTYSLP